MDLKRFVLVAVLMCAVFPAWAKPPIEAFGNRAEIRLMRLSPDGTKAAFIKSQGGENVLVVMDIVKNTMLTALDTSEVKVRDVSWAGSDFVILLASETTMTLGFKGVYEFSAAFAVDLETQGIRQLLTNTPNLYLAQSGLGRILAVSDDGKYVYMPALVGQGEDPTRDLMRVNLRTGRGKSAVSGTSGTIDWITDPKGNALAREDYWNETNSYQLKTRMGGKWKSLLRDESELIPYSLVGIKSDKSALIFIDEAEDGSSDGVFELSRETRKFSGPLMVQDRKEIDHVLIDANRVVHGVAYSGLFRDYAFFDAEIQKDFEGIKAQLGGTAFTLESWSDGFSKLLFLLEAGAGGSGKYLLYDRSTKKAAIIGFARPEIKDEMVGPVQTIEYSSRDGLKIPAIITWPPGVDGGTAEKLPLVVMPHGGPESYDRVGFDWMAQYFANEGYAVLQPNFRGSTGFGLEFRDAGRGQWGLKMQDDVTDGVKAMIKTGWTDPDRVCIVGWSYGGYSALAGGAFTPELYRCVIAGGAVTDLPQMLNNERRDLGSKHWGYAYWQRVIGDSKEEREKLKDVSPTNFAFRFQAPVLLIHGKDDTVVNISQSRLMKDRLRDAGKNVKLVQLKGEDHWLSSSGTRLAALEAMGEFLAKYLKQ
jgi:dipeptidyl aminopeptidase/acylaminoacyl peptidase